MGANSSKTNNTPYTVYISPQRMLGAPGIPSLHVPVRTEKELVKAVIDTGYMRLDPGQAIIGEEGPYGCPYFFNGYKLERESGTTGRLLRVEMFHGSCRNGRGHNITNDYHIDGATRTIHVIDTDTHAEIEASREQETLQRQRTREQETLQRQQTRDDRAATANEYIAYIQMAVAVGTALSGVAYAAHGWWKSLPSAPAPEPEPQSRRQYVSRSSVRGTQRRGNRTQSSSRVQEVFSDSEVESEAEIDLEDLESVSDIEELERFARGGRGSRAASVRA